MNLNTSSPGIGCVWRSKERPEGITPCSADTRCDLTLERTVLGRETMLGACVGAFVCTVEYCEGAHTDNRQCGSEVNLISNDICPYFPDK